MKKNSCYIAYEYVQWLHEARTQIDRLDFDNIVWTKDGKTIEIPQSKKREFNLIGLNNTDFVKFYNPEEEDLCK